MGVERDQLREEDGCRGSAARSSVSGVAWAVGGGANGSRVVELASIVVAEKDVGKALPGCSIGSDARAPRWIIPLHLPLNRAEALSERLGVRSQLHNRVCVQKTAMQAQPTGLAMGLCCCLPALW